MAGALQSRLRCHKKLRVSAVFGGRIFLEKDSSSWRVVAKSGEQGRWADVANCENYKYYIIEGPVIYINEASLTRKCLVCRDVDRGTSIYTNINFFASMGRNWTISWSVRRNPPVRVPLPDLEFRRCSEYFFLLHRFKRACLPSTSALSHPCSRLASTKVAPVGLANSKF